jgi:hypothetical protein
LLGAGLSIGQANFRTAAFLGLATGSNDIRR